MFICSFVHFGLQIVLPSASTTTTKATDHTSTRLSLDPDVITEDLSEAMRNFRAMLEDSHLDNNNNNNNNNNKPDDDDDDDMTTHTLARMSAPMEQVANEVDEAVTEDLRRLSQLLAQCVDPSRLSTRGGDDMLKELKDNMNDDGNENDKKKKEEEEEEDSILGVVDISKPTQPLSSTTTTTTATTTNNTNDSQGKEFSDQDSKFSPLLSTQGKVVIHEVKSSQKYINNVVTQTTKLTVTTRCPGRSLFQDEQQKEEEMEIERAEDELRREIERSTREDLTMTGDGSEEVSFDLGKYLGPPPLSRSLLEDETSTIANPLETDPGALPSFHTSSLSSPSPSASPSRKGKSSIKSGSNRVLSPRLSLRDGKWIDGFERESLIPLPSPILKRSSGGDNSLSLVGCNIRGYFT